MGWRARLSALRLSPATLARRVNEARTLVGRDLTRMQAAFSSTVRERRARFTRTAARLVPDQIERRQKQQAELLASVSRRGDQAISVRLDRLRARLIQADRLLATLKLSEQAILERGYALVLDDSGALVKRAAEVKSGQALELRFADGSTYATASGATAPEPQPKPKSTPKPKPAGDQGSLF